MGSRRDFVVEGQKIKDRIEGCTAPAQDFLHGLEITDPVLVAGLQDRFNVTPVVG